MRIEVAIEVTHDDGSVDSLTIKGTGTPADVADRIREWFTDLALRTP